MMLQLSYLEAALNQGPRPDLFDLETEKHTNILIYIIHKYIKMCNIEKVDKTRTTLYHPMENGQVESFNLFLLQIL